METTSEPPSSCRRHGGKRNRGEREDGNAISGGRDEIRRFSPSRAQIRFRMSLIGALQSGEAVTDTALMKNDVVFSRGRSKRAHKQFLSTLNLEIISTGRPDSELSSHGCACSPGTATGPA